MHNTFLMNKLWIGLSIGILLLETLACSPLEYFVQPEMSDLQLTVDTLKSSLRDAERSMGELRAEVEARRQELADVQIIRAQLDGRVREAERRLTEARHVIELQREELADSRAERERTARVRVALQNQLKQLEKQLSQMRKQATGALSPATLTSPADGESKPMPISMGQELLSEVFVEESGGISKRGTPMPETMSVERNSMLGRMPTVPAHSRVVIRWGDTLWSIAHRYHTSVQHLMSVNALVNDHIQVGQSLWLTESVDDESGYERR